MDCEHLKEILARGEDSRHQFKENCNNIASLVAEISAFANSEGGMLMIGISDANVVTGISKEDVFRLNQWISNSTSAKIEPPIFVQTEILICHDKRILIVHVLRGTNKPYAVSKTIFWVKNGADKRRATREELFRLMHSSHLLFADELETEAGIEDFDIEYFNRYYKKYYVEDIDLSSILMVKLFENLKLIKSGKLALAGLLLFGTKPQALRPQFSIKASYFDGDNIDVDSYRDAENIQRKLIDQFQAGINFVKRNLRRIQRGDDFNVPPSLEIPQVAFSEAIANAIIHRDYFIHSPIFIFMFLNRVEIISPGILPNTVTEENIKFGVHVERNPTILSFLEKDRNFSYSGRGTGIPRLIKRCKDINVKVDFINDTGKQQFKVMFARPGKKSWQPVTKNVKN